MDPPPLCIWLLYCHHQRGPLAAAASHAPAKATGPAGGIKALGAGKPWDPESSQDC